MVKTMLRDGVVAVWRGHRVLCERDAGREEDQGAGDKLNNAHAGHPTFQRRAFASFAYRI